MGSRHQRLRERARRRSAPTITICDPADRRDTDLAEMLHEDGDRDIGTVDHVTPENEGFELHFTSDCSFVVNAADRQTQQGANDPSWAWHRRPPQVRQGRRLVGTCSTAGLRSKPGVRSLTAAPGAFPTDPVRARPAASRAVGADWTS